MSKKNIRDNHRGKYEWINGRLYDIGHWVQRYFEKRTTKRKHKKPYDDEEN